MWNMIRLNKEGADAVPSVDINNLHLTKTESGSRDPCTYQNSKCRYEHVGKRLHYVVILHTNHQLAQLDLGLLKVIYV